MEAMADELMRVVMEVEVSAAVYKGGELEFDWLEMSWIYGDTSDLDGKVGIIGKSLRRKQI